MGALESSGPLSLLCNRASLLAMVASGGHVEAAGILEVVWLDPLMVEVGNGGSRKRSF